MPAFMITILVASGLAWVFLYSRLVGTAPSSFFSIFVFLGTLFVALTLTVSVPFYYFFYTKAPKYSKIRVIYRKSLRWAAYIAVGIVGVMALKAFGLINIVTVGLFVLLYVLIFMQLRGRRV